MKEFARCAVLASALIAATAVAAPDTQAQEQAQEQPKAKSSFWGRLKQEVGSIVAPKGDVGSAFPGTHRRIQDTPLNDIFNSAEAGSDYPHVAIAITDWSDRITSRGMNPTSQAQANDCLTFDVTLWRNSKSSEMINGLIICAGEAHRGYMRGAFDGGFRFASVTGNHTGQRRTTGPLPPANVYPRTAEADGLLDGPGQLLLANLLMEMGLDFSYGGNVGRVWIVSVGNKPGT
jgi:hypothetical protein